MSGHGGGMVKIIALWVDVYICVQACSATEITESLSKFESNFKLRYIQAWVISDISMSGEKLCFDKNEYSY